MEEHMTGEILPPINLGGLEDGSMSRTVKSRQGGRKDAEINKKLEQITEQLKAVRLKRSTLKKYDDGRVYGPKTDYSTVPKKFFSHPRLDYVYGEIMHSPYLTNPKDRYPKAVYTMTEKIKDLKQKGISFNEIPENERPYDQALMKRSFIKEVCNYNPKFNIPKAKKSSTGSVTDSFKRASTANSSILGRSTAGSSISSSATSMKELSRTGPSGFGRPGSSSGTAGRSGSRSGSGSAASGAAGRSSKLNEVKPRKHASSTSMSLDASGFVPSSHNSKSNLNPLPATNTANNDEDNGHKLMKAMSQAVEFVHQNSACTDSMRYTAGRDGEGAKQGDYDPDEEYNDDFADPPEYNTSSAPPTILPTTQSNDDYEQDFESTLVIEPTVTQKQASKAPVASADSAYNEDFETEIENAESSESIPSERFVYNANIAQESSKLGTVAEVNVGNSDVVHSIGSTDETYPDDFAAEPEVVLDTTNKHTTTRTMHNDSIKASTSGSVEDVVQSVGVSPVQSGSVDVYADDFEVPAVQVPVQVAPLQSAVSTSALDGDNSCVDCTDTAIPGASVSGKVDPESIKLRTDLIPGNSNNNSTHSMKTINNTLDTTNTTTHMPLHHENTTHSVLSDQSNQSIKTEEHTFSPPVPSTVRSEIDYSSSYAPIGSTNQSYNNSFRNDNLHDMSGDMEISDSHTEYNTPKREHSNVFSESNSGLKSGIAAVEADIVDDTAVTVPVDAVDTVRTLDTSEVADPIEVVNTVPDSSASVLDNSTVHDTTHILPASIAGTENLDIHARDSPLEFPTSELLDMACDTAYSPTHEIDEILYTEHKNTSVKENATINNNYLNSPSKGELYKTDHDANNVAEEMVVPDSDLHAEVEVEVEAEPDFEVSSPVRGNVETSEIDS